MVRKRMTWTLNINVMLSAKGILPPDSFTHSLGSKCSDLLNSYHERTITMNPMNLLQLKSSWEKFQRNHPKFPLFLNAVSREGLDTGSIVEIKVTTAQGKTFTSNLKVRPEDEELIRELKDLSE